MSTLPRISGLEIASALSKIGYKIDRQKGSHILLREITYPHRRVVVPDHREVGKGTLRKIIKQVGLTIEEFKQLL